MFELVVRVVFSLAVVLGLLWFVARHGSRRLGGAARAVVQVVARQPLARNASLAVVEVGGRVLVVGVSDSGVRLLTELDPADLPETAGADRAEASATVPRVSGSVLSAQTWRQAWAAATERDGRGRE